MLLVVVCQEDLSGVRRQSTPVADRKEKQHHFSDVNYGWRASQARRRNPMELSLRGVLSGKRCEVMASVSQSLRSDRQVTATVRIVMFVIAITDVAQE